MRILWSVEFYENVNLEKVPFRILEIKNIFFFYVNKRIIFKKVFNTLKSILIFVFEYLITLITIMS